MPSTIDTTISGASSNSYVTVTAARSYFDDRLSTGSFLEASSDDQERALLQAAARLNFFNWLGERASTAQALAWPRAGVAKRDSEYFGLYTSGVYIDHFPSDDIPQFVKDAQCELADAYLSGFEEGAPRITKSSQDGLMIEREYSQQAGALPPAVLRLINPYVRGAQRVRA